MVIFFFYKNFNYFLKRWIRLCKLLFFQMPVNSSKTYFNDPKAQVASVEHDDLILIGAVIHDVS